jgi:phage N-6-adenine-methyltransferase
MTEPLKDLTPKFPDEDASGELLASIDKLAPLMSSKNGNWRTPPELFRAIEALAPGRPFTVDAAADARSALCQEFIGPGSPHGEDALHPDMMWGHPGSRIWLNPPYGRMLAPFVQKAIDEIVECPGMEVWLLVPARTDTRWWNDLMPYASDVWFIQGRVRFLLEDGAEGGTAPFPTAVVAISCGTGFRRGPNVRFGWSY